MSLAVIVQLSVTACAVQGIAENGDPSVESDRAKNIRDKTLVPAEEAYRVISLLSHEANDDKLTRPVYYENYELEEVVRRVLAPLNLTCEYSKNVDPQFEVSGVFSTIPAESLSSACKSAGLVWHGGRTGIYICALGDTSDDDIYTITYRLITRDNASLSPARPNAYAAAWRVTGTGWPGMQSRLELNVVDNTTIEVTGFASDHAFFMERVAWAVPDGR
jgi:hypothetical protein